MARREITGGRVLLTGASSGIGEALAFHLAGQGARLLLTARRGDRLESIADRLSGHGERPRCVVGDITGQDTRNQLIEAARSEFGGLDILINNAGIGAIGPFATASHDRLRHVMEVNFFAPAELIRDSLPLLRSGNRPMIVNVASVLGHFAVPGKSEYCASKFALHGFSDALRCELLADGIDVLLLSPSTTRSEFFQHLVEDQGRSAAGPLSMSANAVARRAVTAIRKGRRELILSASGKAAVAFDRVFPSLASRLFARFG